MKWQGGAEIDLVWIPCSSSEGWNLNFSRGAPTNICHQVHLANDIQGAASHATILPSRQVCWKSDVVLSLILENGTTMICCGSQAVYSPGLCLAVKQTVHLSRCSPTSVYLKANQLAGRAVFAFFSWMLGQCRLSLGILMRGSWVSLWEDCVSLRQLEWRNLENI